MVERPVVVTILMLRIFSMKSLRSGSIGSGEWFIVAATFDNKPITIYMMSFVITAKNVSTKNPRLMYPAQENRSTTSSSNPFERKIIGMIGSVARIAMEVHVMILKW